MPRQPFAGVYSYRTGRSYSKKIDSDTKVMIIEAMDSHLANVRFATAVEGSSNTAPIPIPQDYQMVEAENTCTIVTCYRSVLVSVFMA